jgi:hypothetical protein
MAIRCENGWLLLQDSIIKKSVPKIDPDTGQNIDEQKWEEGCKIAHQILYCRENCWGGLNCQVEANDLPSVRSAVIRRGAEVMSEVKKSLEDEDSNT